MVFFPRLIHADFCADGAVEVVTTAVDPGVAGAQLDSRDIVFLRDTLTGVSLLDCVSSAMVLDAEVTRFREVSAVGLELVVHEELVGGDALRLGDRLAGVSVLDGVLLAAAGTGRWGSCYG